MAITRRNNLSGGRYSRRRYDKHHKYDKDGRLRKAVPWKGWAKIEPKGRERTTMYRKCGKRCFLGTIKRYGRDADRQHPDFPICKKGTCDISSKGLYAAYIRAKQWGKARSSYKSKGKWVNFKTKDGVKRVWYKGSRPTRKRSVYTSVARRAKRMLERRGYHVGN